MLYRRVGIVYAEYPNVEKDVLTAATLEGGAVRKTRAEIATEEERTAY